MRKEEKSGGVQLLDSTGVAVTERDGHVTVCEALHPKCPSCGHIFAEWSIGSTPADAIATTVVEEDGKPYIMLCTTLFCECGYILECDLDAKPPRWWGHHGEDGERDELTIWDLAFLRNQVYRVRMPAVSGARAQKKMQ